MEAARCASWWAPASRSTRRSSSRCERAWGITHPRRLRPDRDDRADRQFAGPAGEAGLDGPAAAGLPHRAARSPTAARRTRARSALDLEPAAAGADGRATCDDAERRRQACAAASTTPATSPAATTTATISYVGRADDVFKSSDYRISPFELESALIEHDAVAEAAVVPSPDALRLRRAEGVHRAASRASSRRETRRAIFAFCRERLAPYKRIRRIEFARAAEDDLRQDPPRRAAQAGSSARYGAGHGDRVPRGRLGRLITGGVPACAVPRGLPNPRARTAEQAKFRQQGTTACSPHPPERTIPA